MIPTIVFRTRNQNRNHLTIRMPDPFASQAESAIEFSQIKFKVVDEPEFKNLFPTTLPDNC